MLSILRSSIPVKHFVHPLTIKLYNQNYDHENGQMARRLAGRLADEILLKTYSFNDVNNRKLYILDL